MLAGQACPGRQTELYLHIEIRSVRTREGTLSVRTVRFPFFSEKSDTLPRYYLIFPKKYDRV